MGAPRQPFTGSSFPNGACPGLIGFRLIVAGPDDMVVTSCHQYHAVLLNITSCLAISINFTQSPGTMAALTRAGAHQPTEDAVTKEVRDKVNKVLTHLYCISPPLWWLGNL